MKKFEKTTAIIKKEDGTEVEYNVFMKWRQTNIVDENGKTHYGVFEPTKIFYSDDDIEEMINCIKS